MNQKFWAKQAKLITDTSAILDLSGVLGGEEGDAPNDFPKAGVHFYNSFTGEYIGYQAQAQGKLVARTERTNGLKFFPQGEVCFVPDSSVINATGLLARGFRASWDFVSEHYPLGFEGSRKHITQEEFIRKVIYIYGESGGHISDWYAWAHKMVMDSLGKGLEGRHVYSPRANHKIKTQKDPDTGKYVSSYVDAVSFFSTNFAINSNKIASRLKKVILNCYYSLNEYTNYIPVDFSHRNIGNWFGQFGSIDKARMRVPTDPKHKDYGQPIVLVTQTDFFSPGSINLKTSRFSWHIFFRYGARQPIPEKDYPACRIRFVRDGKADLLHEIPQGQSADAWFSSLSSDFLNQLNDFYNL